MAASYVIPIIKGETFVLTLIIRDNAGIATDLTDSVFTVQCSDGLEEILFTTVLGSETGYVTIKATAENTALFDAGVFDMRVWAEWPTGDIVKEVIMEAQIVVKENL
jgi:hypothetical protein